MTMLTNDFTEQDAAYMQQALDLAAKGIYTTAPNPAVGCVLVKAGTVVGEGWHQKAGLPHAEREALAIAGEYARGATAYVTLEPCSHVGRTPPCADGLIEAGVSRVIVAMRDPNPLVAGQGIARIEAAGIQVEVGLLEKQARLLNQGFIMRMEHQRPFVRLKMASSLDGRTAMSDGESKWITGLEAREIVHQLRAKSGAVITGIGSVLMDDPSMNVRLSPQRLDALGLTEQPAQPLRVVLDSKLRFPLDAKMLSAEGPIVVMTSENAMLAEADKAEVLTQKGVEVVAVPSSSSGLALPAVLEYLANQVNINDVMVESGATLAGAWIESGLVDELHSFIAPVLMGDQAKPMFVLPSVQRMLDKKQFEVQSTAMVGRDAYLRLTPLKELRD